MEKLPKIGLATLIGAGIGLAVASFFDVQNDTAYYAVVAIFMIVATSVAAWAAR